MQKVYNLNLIDINMNIWIQFSHSESVKKYRLWTVKNVMRYEMWQKMTILLVTFQSVYCCFNNINSMNQESTIEFTDMQKIFFQ